MTALSLRKGKLIKHYSDVGEKLTHWNRHAAVSDEERAESTTIRHAILTKSVQLTDGLIQSGNFRFYALFVPRYGKREEGGRLLPIDLRIRAGEVPALTWTNATTRRTKKALKGTLHFTFTGASLPPERVHEVTRLIRDALADEFPKFHVFIGVFETSSSQAAMHELHHTLDNLEEMQEYAERHYTSGDSGHDAGMVEAFPKAQEWLEYVAGQDFATSYLELVREEAEASRPPPDHKAP